MPKSIRNYEKKNNAWNIRRLVDDSFVPLTQRIILKIDGFQMSELGQLRPRETKYTNQLRHNGTKQIYQLMSNTGPKNFSLT